MLLAGPRPLVVEVAGSPAPCSLSPARCARALGRCLGLREIGARFARAFLSAGAFLGEPFKGAEGKQVSGWSAAWLRIVAPSRPH